MFWLLASLAVSAATAIYNACSSDDDDKEDAVSPAKMTSTSYSSRVTPSNSSSRSVGGHQYLSSSKSYAPPPPPPPRPKVNYSDLKDQGFYILAGYLVALKGTFVTNDVDLVDGYLDYYKVEGAKRENAYALLMMWKQPNFNAKLVIENFRKKLRQKDKDTICEKLISIVLMCSEGKPAEKVLAELKEICQVLGTSKQKVDECIMNSIKNADTKRKKNTGVVKYSGDIESAYKILGVDANMSLEEAYKKWKDVRKLYHPDRYVSVSVEKQQYAEKEFKEINLAWEFLKSQNVFATNSSK